MVVGRSGNGPPFDNGKILGAPRSAAALAESCNIMVSAVLSGARTRDGTRYGGFRANLPALDMPPPCQYPCPQAYPGVRSVLLIGERVSIPLQRERS